jgi:hypothetical protein
LSLHPPFLVLIKYKKDLLPLHIEGAPLTPVLPSPLDFQLPTLTLFSQFYIQQTAYKMLMTSDPLISAKG